MSKAVIIGIDGFDPQIVQQLIKNGRLPAFAYLKDKGSFAPLLTVNPPQSPVVWATIATGVNPGQHGLFDFICRDPQTYLPHLAIYQKNEKNILGLRSALFKPAHAGIPFWQITSANGISTTVIKWPVEFPPAKIKGKFLSGLGVPDIKNTLGRYTVYTTKAGNLAKELKGDVIYLDKGRQVWQTFIFGPEDTKIPLKIFLDSKNKQILLQFNGKEKITVKQNQWSDWLTFDFRHRFGRQYRAIARFLLSSLSPEIELYLSSLHVDPKKPLFPISHPDSYAAQLASNIGDYHTLGLPEETNGLNDEFLSLDDFLGLTATIQHERELMFWQEYKNFKQGLFAFVFDTLDRLQHMFWFTRDSRHPIYREKVAKKYSQIIFSYYQQLDSLIGKILPQDDKMLLLVISDHGFYSFRRAVHLNSWLIKTGFMSLKKGELIGRDLFDNVDWGQTVAYALGFSSIYLNLQGREKQGTVPIQQAGTLLKKIKQRLKKLKDTKTNEQIFHNVYLTSQIYQGRFMDRAPDIVVGMKPGYRVSWQTAVGAAPAQLMEDNTRRWCGDHLIDASFVPGVFFSNRKIKKANPTVFDICPTILGYFGIKPPKSMEGDQLLIFDF